MSETVRLYNVMTHSTVNGPGNRFVIWLQGCPLHCPGCFNQPTHDINGGVDMNIEKLAAQINQTPDIRGITLSGGEPLLQPELLRRSQNARLHIPVSI